MRLSSLIAIATLMTAASAPASAQVRDTKVITAEAAQRILVGAQAEARRNGWNMSCAVVDPSGELIAFIRMDDASPGSIDISRAKARTAARFKRETKLLEDAVAGGRNALLSFEGVVLVEGGVPVVINGGIVGAVGCSGGTSPQDAQVAKAGIASLTP
ncbi:MAG: hypothetical protein JWO05_3012 [Gemmatimonadetes bacterium]|nr:hypothetical protein [Gemmatimonadota bacterium]